MNNKTRTYRYLFEPSITLFHSPSVRGLLLNEKIGFKVLNVYLKDESIEDSSFEDGVFYILVDTTHNNFIVNIEKLKKESVFYVDNYIISQTHAIIRFNSFKGALLENFLNSKYSKMYDEDVLQKYKSRFQKINNNGKLEVTQEYQVLTCDAKLKSKLVKEISENKAELEYYNEIITELDSTIKPHEETINSETYATTAKE